MEIPSEMLKKEGKIDNHLCAAKYNKQGKEDCLGWRREVESAPP